MSIDLIMSKSTTHPLVQYVSKQQCLKKMELPYPLALQIVKQANKFWISEMIQMYRVSFYFGALFLYPSAPCS